MHTSVIVIFTADPEIMKGTDVAIIYMYRVRECMSICGEMPSGVEKFVKINERTSNLIPPKHRQATRKVVAIA